MPQSAKNTMGSLSQAKTLGGVGSILVLLTIIPTVGVVLAIIGFVMTLIAVKYISDYLQDSAIFRNMIIAIGLSIVGFVVVAVIVAASVFSFIGLGSLNSGTVTPSPGLFGALAGIVVGLVIGWIVLVLSAYFLRKAYNTVGLKLNVGMFKTAALIYFIGAILTIIVVGLLLILIAQILLIVAFFSIPDMPMASGPGLPPSPPGSPSMATQPGAPLTGTKFCVKCGASLAQDASFCPNCGASQPPSM
jgi:uncharacterized membrane protein